MPARAPGDELTLRRRFIRRASPDGAGEDASTRGTTWLAGDACRGSVDRDNLWTQRHAPIDYWRTDAAPAAPRLRFLHAGRDFASAGVRNAQRGPRVLAALGLLTERGDFHPTLDRPAGGRFAAEDFRVRFELTGDAVAAAPLGEGRFALVAGARRAVIHTPPGRFGPHAVAWRLGRDEGRVYLDGVCYHGPRREFDPAALGGVAIVAGLELLRTDEEPAATPPTSREPGDGTLWATRDAVGDARVVAPLRAEPSAQG